MNLVNLLIAIVLTVILFVIFRWLVGLASVEFGLDMPNGVIAAIALLLAIVFGWVGYTNGPRIWTRP